MKYTVVSSAEFTYPDLFEYPSASASIAVFAARLLRLQPGAAARPGCEGGSCFAARDRALADEICASVFRSFREVEYGVGRFTEAKRRLLAALSE